MPKDAKNDTVNLYFHLYHVKGILYGDVAQLETGNAANRCNLVENGSFHLGNTCGFTKIGTEEDTLITVDSSVDIPIQKGLKGYVPASQAIPCVSSSKGVYNGVTAMKNGILYGKIPMCTTSRESLPV